MLAIVAEKTGYPPDMLDLDLDLEADLGIDTVKQAEVFAAIRETYGIARDDSLKLRDYPTLNHVVGFVRERAGAAARRPRPAAPEPAPAAAGGAEAGAPTGFPRRVPVPVVRPPLDRCVADRRRARRGQPRRRDARPRRRRQRRSPSGSRKLGVEVLAIDGEPDGRGARGPDRRVDGRGPDPRRLLAARPRRRGPARRARSRRLARGAARAREAAGDDDARARRPGLGARHVPRRGDPPRRPPRLRRGRRDLGAGRRGRPASPRRSSASATEALVKAVDFAPSRKTAALADLLVDETLRDPGAVEVGYADELRWTVGLVERAAEPDPARERSRPDDRVRRHRRRRQHRLGDHRRPRGRVRRHLPPARPGPRARPGRSRPRRASPPTATGSSASSPSASRSAASGPTPELVERELARIERARAALGRASRRSARPAARRTGTRSTSPTRRRSRRRSPTCSRQRPGRRRCCTPPGSRSATSCPTSRRRSSTWSSTSRPTAGSTSCTRSRDAAIGTRRRLQLDRRPLRQRRPDRLRAANDLLCKSISHLRRPSPATRGIAIDWTAWADIGMATRGSIPKMMEVAGHRHAAARAIGVPVVRRELTAAGAGGEVVVAGSLGHAARRAPPDRRARPRCGDEGRGARRGPMTGRIAALTVGDGLERADRARPGRQPFLDDHRIDGTPGAARRDGDRGVRRGGAGAAARLARRRRRGRRLPGARSSSTATSRARSSCGRCCATAATARSSPTAAWSAGARCPARASRRPSTSPAGCG